MTLENSRCPNHPSQPVVGICASCLRERLIALTRLEDKGLSNSSTSSSIKNGFIFAEGVSDAAISPRDKTYGGIDGRRNAANSGNSSRGILRARSFSMQEDSGSVANMSEGIEDGAFASKKTLWTLFNLEDVERPKRVDIKSYPERKDTQVQNSRRNDSRAEYYNSRKIGNGLEKSSISEDDRKNSSWLQALFRRKVRSRSAQKSRESVEESTRPNSYTDKATGRPSSSSRQEQINSSSWEGTRPAGWEPDSPSFEGYVSASDTSSFIRRMPSQGGRESEISEWGRKGRQDVINGRRHGLSIEGEHGLNHASKLESAMKLSASTTLYSDDQKGIVLSKPATNHSMRRDVSTETTPVRAPGPGSTGRTPCNRSARAASSWSKALVASPIWVFKHRHKLPTNKEMTQNHSVAASSSTALMESAKEAFHNGPPPPLSREYTLWNPYFSPVMRKTGKVIQKVYKDHDNVFDRSRTVNFSPSNMESGLLRFYLTPLRTRGGSRAKSGRGGGLRV